MIGLSDTSTSGLDEKKKAVSAELKRLQSTSVRPSIINPLLQRLGTSTVKESTSLYQLLKRPEVKYSHLASVAPSEMFLSDDVLNQVEIQTKYKGYIDRQADLAERSKKVEDRKIPENFVYKGINGLSIEIVEKLEEVRPLNIGQASRIPGVTPAAVSLLMVAVAKHTPQSSF